MYNLTYTRNILQVSFAIPLVFWFIFHESNMFVREFQLPLCRGLIIIKLDSPRALPSHDTKRSQSSPVPVTIIVPDLIVCILKCVLHFVTSEFSTPLNLLYTFLFLPKLFVWDKCCFCPVAVVTLFFSVLHFTAGVNQENYNRKHLISQSKSFNWK